MALMFTANLPIVGPKTMTSICLASSLSWSVVTPMVLAASSMALVSPESSTSWNEIVRQSSGTGNRMPVLGASIHMLPAGSSGVPVAGGVALAPAAVDPAGAADSVVDGDWPPHPATASAAMVTATDDLAMVLFPLMADTVAASEVTSRGHEERPSAALRGLVACRGSDPGLNS